MKKIIAFLVLASSLVACNNDTDEFKVITDQINEYKMEILDIQSEIQKLEKILADSNKSVSTGSVLVGTQNIKPQSFTHYVDITGNVEADKEAFVSPEINGMIKHIAVKEGDYVKKGQLLASIDTDITRNTISELETQHHLAKTMYEKQEKLWKEKIGSEVQYLQAKSNKESLEKKIQTLKTQLKMASIRAPFSGYIEVVYQKAGEIGSPGRQLFHLVNLQSLNVTANMSESYIPYVHKGDTAQINFPTFPDIHLEEPVEVIGSVINPNNRTIKIQIPIHNKDNALKPNIIANLKLVDIHLDSAIVIPSIVVKNDAEGRNYVYLVSQKGNKLTAKKQFIEIGQSYGNNTMIVSGLEPNDQVIIQGYNLVKNGSIIKIKQ